jgi:hypothetical protein
MQTGDLLRPAPTGRTRTLVNVFIVCFLVFQVAVPLTYYLGRRTTDERFSWRMFSSVILQICTVSAFESGSLSGERAFHKVNLWPDLHPGWIRLLERYPPQLVAAVLRWRCERTNAKAVHLMRQCQNPGGAALPPDRISIDCASGTMQTPAG